MNKYILEEIMNLPIDGEDSIGLITSISYIQRFANVELMTNEHNDIYYQVLVSDLLLSDIDSDTLMQLRNNGWGLSSDKTKILKKI